jgi:hypothetical protein
MCSCCDPNQRKAYGKKQLSFHQSSSSQRCESCRFSKCAAENGSEVKGDGAASQLTGFGDINSCGCCSLQDSLPRFFGQC